MELSGLKSSGVRSLNIAALANGTNNNSLSSFGSDMRPAMSLAQLCDLTPEEAPSSHRLIAQWESLIKKNAEGVETAIWGGGGGGWHPLSPHPQREAHQIQVIIINNPKH